MTAWPPIAEAKLLDRLALDDEQFERFAERLFARVPAREFSEADLQHALAYPWQRPVGSFQLVDGSARPISAAPSEVLEAIDADRRFPLLAYGSNASPEALGRKFADLTPGSRDAIVVRGVLQNFDVGASAHAAYYGAMPATIFASPGTQLECAVAWVTEQQLTAIAWSEVNYHFGALSGAHFRADIDAQPVDRLFAFVSRRGAYAPAGNPIALAGVDATERTATALTQRELLERAAAAAQTRAGPDADAAANLLRELFADYAGTGARVVQGLREHATPFAAPNWSRYPSG